VDKRYLHAFLSPPKFVIGGIEMDYFCPRHFITLQIIDSPFLNPTNRSLGGKDLFTALRICSTENWIKSLDNLSILERWRYLKIECIPENKQKAFTEFGEYLTQSMSVPKIWVKDSDKSEGKKPTNIPETLSLVVILMTKFGFSEMDAWNMPFSKAIWYSTAYASQEGAEISVITTGQEESESKDLSKLEDFEKRMSEIVTAKAKTENEKAKRVNRR
jgi:hypothetical protein